jgi:hypothetical protein
MSELQDLLENARNEIRKANGEIPISDKKKSDASSILNQSMMFADNVLKRLIALTINRRVDDIFETCLNTRGSVLITSINQEDNSVEEKYTLELDIVDSDYMLDLGKFKDHPEIKERLSFLLNTVKVLYCPIKDYMKKWVKTDQKNPAILMNGELDELDNSGGFDVCRLDDDEKYVESNDLNKKITMFNYVLQIGLNTTLFIDKDSKKRIGVILKRVKDFPTNQLHN